MNYADSIDISPNGRRLRLQPICQTDAFMASRHDFPRITEGIKLSSRLANPVANVHLSDVLTLIDALPAHLRAPAVLQGTRWSASQRSLSPHMGQD